MLTNDQAVCIRAVDYSETSQVVTFFTRQTGKVTVIAKGAKRQKSPFGGPIEVFSSGNIVFSDSGRDKLAALAEFEPVSGIIDTSVLSQDLYVLNCCLFSVEMINLLTKDYDPHPDLFDGLLKFLHEVSEQKNSRSAVLSHLVLFQLRLLKEIGLSPVFGFCVNCKNPFNERWPEVYFSINAKGLVCKDCQGPFPDKVSISKQAVAALLNVESLAEAQQKVLMEIENFLVHYINEELGRPVKMAKYILKQ